MMSEATKIAGFGEDGQRQDRAYAGHLLQVLKIAIVLELMVRSLFQLFP